ncbi:MAG: tRNA (N6-isopentenyl adenosine(37)-C2)-methylthiotransferase MiaB [bacterium]
MNLDKKNNRNRCFFIETYGCQMNKNDSERISNILQNNGFLKANTMEKADIIIINTCSVRQHAENRALGRARGLASWKKKSSKRRLGIVGCTAQRLGKELVEKIPHVDFILGPDQYRHFPDIIYSSDQKSVINTEFQDNETYEKILPTINDNSVSSFVTITRGCSNFCSYCIVPYTRGKLRSRDSNDIIREIEFLVDSGKNEIILLGQNVNSYFDGKYHFSDLLKKVSRINGVLRVRFMTSHPKDLSEDILQVIRQKKNICSHLHLPVQSGSTRILSLMNRQYSRENYINLIVKARGLIPELSLTTDIMVGFPGETEEDFQETVDLMKKIAFDNAYLYRYSSRPGTRAATMKNQIPEKIKLKRLNSIIQLQRKISLKKKQAMIGQEVEVMPETYSKYSANELLGKTSTNFNIIFPGDETIIGNLVSIKLKECKGATLKGELIT